MQQILDERVDVAEAPPTPRHESAQRQNGAVTDNSATLQAAFGCPLRGVLGCWSYYGSLEKKRYIGLASTLEGLMLS